MAEALADDQANEARGDAATTNLITLLAATVRKATAGAQGPTRTDARCDRMVLLMFQSCGSFSSYSWTWPVLKNRTSPSSRMVFHTAGEWRGRLRRRLRLPVRARMSPWH